MMTLYTLVQAIQNQQVKARLPDLGKQASFMQVISVSERFIKKSIMRPVPVSQRQFS